jgi:hypothetical protein
MKKLFLSLVFIFGLLFNLNSGPASNTTTVNLAWDYDFTVNPDVAGFYIYYGVNNNNIPNWNGTNVVCGCYTNFVLAVGGLVTNTTIVNLERGLTYYFTATTVSTNGIESDNSNEVRYTVPKKPVPAKNLIIR